jgi:hypothetical protein
MAIFGRKKEEEFEDEDEFEDGGREDRKLTKKFKDLKSENKKKRKEPPKPWGKKERIIVLSVLLATAIISAILSFSNSFSLEPIKLRLNTHKFSLKSLNIFKGETIIIQKK